jgi:hypothetical protein
MDVQKLSQHANLITRIYPENTLRKNYFLAACKLLDESVYLANVHEDCPYGGTIGIGDSRLDKLFRHFKIFRLHAIMHDAAGHMRERYNVGPGYCYVLNHFPINSCLIAHISGLAYCIYLKVFSSFYNVLEC